MFGFLLSFIHIFIDVTCDDNNRIITRIYQFLLFRGHGLYRLVIACTYRIVGYQLLKNSHDTIVTPKIVTFVVDKIFFPMLIKKNLEKMQVMSFYQHRHSLICATHLMKMKCYLPHQNLFLGPLVPHVFSIFDHVANLTTSKTSHLSIVINCLKVMTLTLNISNKLKTLIYDTMNIQKVLCLPTRFDGDILFELPPK